MGVAAHSTAQQDRTCPPPSPPFSLLLLPPPGVRSIGGEAKAWLLTAGEESPASPPPLPLLPSQRQWKECGTAVVPQVTILAYRIMEPARAVRAGSGWESPPTTLSYAGFESWAARALPTATL
ncbi:hypothetical protein CLOP_g1162 [Closterium sp. NIES-67]|nr:hypothetical protein CLOP_g1162 [Closterium sp. NIES-67]